MTSLTRDAILQVKLVITIFSRLTKQCFCPMAIGGLKTNASVIKTLTWVLSSKVLMFEHSYLTLCLWQYLSSRSILCPWQWPLTLFKEKFAVCAWGQNYQNFVSLFGFFVLSVKRLSAHSFKLPCTRNYYCPHFSFKWSFSLCSYTCIPRMNCMLDFICMAPVDLSRARWKRQNVKWKILVHVNWSVVFSYLSF